VAAYTRQRSSDARIHLVRVLGVAGGDPRPWYRLALISQMSAGAAVAVIAITIRPPHQDPQPQRVLLATGLAGLATGLALLLLSVAIRGRVRLALPDRVMAPQDRAAVWLALACWLPLLVIVAYYRAEATLPPAVKWINFGFDDKHWQTAGYLSCALAPMILLVASDRVLRTAREQPESWRVWLGSLFPLTPALPNPSGAAAGRAGVEFVSHRRTGPAMRTLACGLVTALAIAWYFLGPPWFIGQGSGPISAQEEVFLTGFQAVASGHLPYVGVAGVQYGPGTQLASYLFMRDAATFSVAGFREAWAVFQWAGASILFCVFFAAFGYARGLGASLLAVLIYPSLQQVAFHPGSGFTGLWAWANPLRYVGAVALILLLPSVILRIPPWRRIAAGVALGALWGLMAYMAQENLAAGAVGALVVAMLLLCSGTAPRRATGTALLAVLAGFAVIWVPILGFYTVRGDLGPFLNLYSLSPRAVAAGYSNTSWQGSSHRPSPLTTMFYVLPWVLAVLSVLTVLEFRPLRVATGWSRERVLLAASLLTTILLYQGALLRSDTSHLTGTLLAVPALVVVAGSALPRLLGGRRRAVTAMASAALIAASFALLPVRDYAPATVRAVAEAPYLDRVRLAALPAARAPATLAAGRVGPGLAAGPGPCCQALSEPMPQLIRLMNQIHAIVGSRVAYVANVPRGYPGIAYFLADLNPAPVLWDKYTTILNEPELRAYMEYFRTEVLPHTQALLTDSLTAPEARFFLTRYPSSREVPLQFSDHRYYVLLRRL
jgi:hypothetical protein